jgi:hypothetical protein
MGPLLILLKNSTPRSTKMSIFLVVRPPFAKRRQNNNNHDGRALKPLV